MRRTPQLLNEMASLLDAAQAKAATPAASPMQLEWAASAWGPLDISRLLTIVADRCYLFGDIARRQGQPMKAARWYAQSRRCIDAATLLMDQIEEGDAP